MGRSARRYTLRGASWRADSVSSPGPLLVESPVCVIQLPTPARRRRSRAYFLAHWTLLPSPSASPVLSCHVMFALFACLCDVCLRGDGRSRRASLHPSGIQPAVGSGVATARQSAAICQRRRPNSSRSPTPAQCAGRLSARPGGYPRPNSGAALPVALRVERDGPSDSHKGPAPRVETRACPMLLGSKTCAGNSAAVDTPEWGRRW